MDVSAVLLTYRRADYLRECLDSLVAADRRSLVEILAVVNGDDPESVRVLESYKPRLPELRALVLERKTRGGARNEAAAAAKGDVLYFLDDDLAVAPDLFAKAAELFARHPDVWAAGGPNLTPPTDSRFQQAVGAVLSSRFGAWTMSRRYAPRGAAGPADDRSLMLCSLGVRRDAFAQAGLAFDDRLASAEENLLLSELAARGRGLYYDPELVVYHHRRPDFLGFVTQTFKCGAGRWQATRVAPSSFSPLFALPSALVVLLLAAPLLPRAFTAPLLDLYLLLAAAQAALYAFSAGGLVGGALAFALIPAGHLSYGLGFLLGETAWAKREASRRTASLPGWSDAAARSSSSASAERPKSANNRA
jgi:GT2 family glycosyltransferase